MGVVDRRVYPAGRDGVAADPLLHVVERDALGQHDDRALRGRVHGEERLGDDAVHRACVDQRAAARAQHVGDGVPHPYMVPLTLTSSVRSITSSDASWNTPA